MSQVPVTRSEGTGFLAGLKTVTRTCTPVIPVPVTRTGSPNPCQSLPSNGAGQSMEGWTEVVWSGDAARVQTEIHADDRCESKFDAITNKHHGGHDFHGNAFGIPIRSGCDAN